MKEIKCNPDNGIVYHEYECIECGKTARNTYTEPNRTQMKERQLCFTCNFYVQFAEEQFPKRNSLTIIAGNIYTPGNRTEGNFRGMAGRRFDIEYIEPSIHAGKKITTFDLWSGSTLPEKYREKFPDTARFLGGAEKVDLGKGGLYEACFEPSNGKSLPYPLPHEAGIK